MVNLKICGKVFLLGEYSVVVGNPALIASTQPEFQLISNGKNASPSGLYFHPHSPIGRLQEWARFQLKALGATLEELGLEFYQLLWKDPMKSETKGTSASGLGSSTAEFAAYYFALAHHAPQLKLDASPEGAWKGAYVLYRELHSGDFVPPSGADLVAQMLGGIIEFSPDRFWRGDMDRSYKRLEARAGFSGFPVALFTIERQVGRKVATHHHLAALKTQGFFKSPLMSQLRNLTQRGSDAIVSEDWKKLGEAFTDYAELLCSYGLELETTAEDRQAFMKFPGVLGSKGMGALQADGILVVCKPDLEPAEWAPILEMAESRKLTGHRVLGGELNGLSQFRL